MLTENYVLDVGDNDLKRMSLLSSIYLPFNIKFINKQGSLTGLKVADIGCGPGDISLWLADQVGETGKVTAIDNNQEQLNILSQRLATQQRNNIGIQHANIYDLSQMGMQFDLIFCRFLFVHLQHPIDALQQLHSALTSNGKIIIAELDNDSWSSIPTNSALQKDTSLLCQTGKLRGVDLKIGSKLVDFFQQFNFSSIINESYQPILETPLQREYLFLKLKAWGKVYLQYNLITASELEELFIDIKKLVSDTSIQICAAKMYQVCGVL